MDAGFSKLKTVTSEWNQLVSIQSILLDALLLHYRSSSIRRSTQAKFGGLLIRHPHIVDLYMDSLALEELYGNQIAIIGCIIKHVFNFSNSLALERHKVNPWDI